MRQTSIKARELFDVDVSHISLVGRPSTRVPFSFTKSESKKGGGMFDNIFKTEAKPLISAVVVKGEQPSEAVIEALKAEGIAVDEPQSADGVTIFPQEGSVGNTVTVKLSEDLAVMVPVFKMSGAFADACAHRGFYPAVSIATDALNEEIHKAVYKSDTPSEAAGRVKALTDDFGNYITQVVQGLPQQVFKLEKSAALTDAIAGANNDKVKEGLEEAQKAASGADDGKDGPNGSATPKGKPLQKPHVQAVKGDPGTGGTDISGSQHLTDHKAGTDNVDEKGKKKTKTMKTVDGTEVEVVIEDGETDTEVEKTDGGAASLDTEALTKSIMDGVQGLIKPLADRIEEVAGNVDTAVEKSEAASKTVKKAVFGGVFDQQDDDEDERDTVRKNDRHVPLLDTGFSTGR